MKTLGQEAFDAWKSTIVDESRQTYRWEDVSQSTWEIVGEAVRAAVIEECAKVCDEFVADPDTTVEIARAIRSLK